MQTRFPGGPGMAQNGKPKVLPQPRPPHNPARSDRTTFLCVLLADYRSPVHRYVSISTQYVLATPQRMPMLA